MSAAQLERNFVNNLIRRCDNIFFNRIESMTSVGFPDLVLVWGSQLRVAEAKVIHPGDWVYIRNTQFAWGYKALAKSFDVPFLLGMAGQGISMFKFSRLIEIPGQAYKGTHKRFKVHDIFPYGTAPPFAAGKYDDWEKFVLHSLYT